MKIRLVQQDWDKVECDALIVPLFEDDDSNEGIPSSLDERLGGLVSELRESGEWTGKAGEITVLYRPLNLDVPRVVLLGGGKQRQYDPGAIRNLICQAVRRLKGYRIRRVAVFRRSFFSPEEVAQAAVDICAQKCAEEIEKSTHKGWASAFGQKLIEDDRASARFHCI